MLTNQASKSSRDRFLGATTYLTPIDETYNRARNLILHSNDLVRWLYFQDTGTDFIQINPELRRQMNKRYLVHIWGQGGDLTGYLNSLSDSERETTKKNLTKILTWAKPFLDHRKTKNPSLKKV